MQTTEAHGDFIPQPERIRQDNAAIEAQGFVLVYERPLAQIARQRRERDMARARPGIHELGRKFEQDTWSIS